MSICLHYHTCSGKDLALIRVFYGRTILDFVPPIQVLMLAHNASRAETRVSTQKRYWRSLQEPMDMRKFDEGSAHDQPGWAQQLHMKVVLLSVTCCLALSADSKLS